MEYKGIVTWVGEPKEHSGKMQIGFRIDSEVRFFNIQKSKEDLESLKTAMLHKGAIIEFDMVDDYVATLTKTGMGTPKSTKKENWAEDMVSFEVLLKDAHDKKEDFSIRTEMLQVDFDKKTALFKATIEVMRQDVIIRFEGHGDASMESVSSDNIKPHFIRMAETRAIARALRWYVNHQGGCAKEEAE